MSPCVPGWVRGEGGNGDTEVKDGGRGNRGTESVLTKEREGGCPIRV